MIARFAIALAPDVEHDLVARRRNGHLNRALVAGISGDACDFRERAGRNDHRIARAADHAHAAAAPRQAVTIRRRHRQAVLFETHLDAGQRGAAFIGGSRKSNLVNHLA